MKSFSVSEFNVFLDKQLASVEMGFLGTMTEIGAILQKDAKDRIGHYHAQVGPFPMWDELAQFTKDERLAQGYSDDEPLYREGDLRNAIEKEPTPWLVLVGVKNGQSKDGKATFGEIAAWQEFGAARKGIPWIPPRPFVGPALYATMNITLPLAAAAVLSRFTGISEAAFTGHHFSRIPITTMSAEVFARGKAITGGK